MIINYLNLRVGTEKVNKLYQNNTIVYGDKTVQPKEKDYFYIRAAVPTQLGSSVKLIQLGDPTYPLDLEYSYDKETWNTYTIGQELILSYTLSGTLKNERVYFRGENVLRRSTGEPYKQTLNDYEQNPSSLVWDEYATSARSFELDEGSAKEFYIGGNIMSLLCKDDFEEYSNYVPEFSFYGLFGNSPRLLGIDNPDTLLPAKTVAPAAYALMFMNTGITLGPTLNGNVLGYGCYDSIFAQCPNINEVTIYAESFQPSWKTPPFNDWLLDVGVNNGLIHNLGNAEDWPSGSASGRPGRWAIVNF